MLLVRNSRNEIVLDIGSLSDVERNVNPAEGHIQNI